MNFIILVLICALIYYLLKGFVNFQISILNIILQLLKFFIIIFFVALTIAMY